MDVHGLELFKKKFVPCETGQLSEPFDEAYHDQDEGDQDGHPDDQETPPGNAADGYVVGHLLFFCGQAHDGGHEGETQEEIAYGGRHERSRQNPGGAGQQALIVPFPAAGRHCLFYSGDVEQLRCVNEHVEQGDACGAGDDDGRRQNEGDQRFLAGKEPGSGAVDAASRPDDEDADDAGESTPAMPTPDMRSNFFGDDQGTDSVH